MNAKKPTKRKTSQDPAAQRALLLVLLLSFTICAGILAFKLNPGIVPDENAHFIFAKHYASTWGIPPDAPETYAQGWYIAHYPFL